MKAIGCAAPAETVAAFAACMQARGYQRRG